MAAVKTAMLTKGAMPEDIEKGGKYTILFILLTLISLFRGIFFYLILKCILVYFRLSFHIMLYDRFLFHFISVLFYLFILFSPVFSPSSVLGKTFRPRFFSCSDLDSPAASPGNPQPANKLEPISSVSKY